MFRIKKRYQDILEASTIDRPVLLNYNQKSAKKSIDLTIRQDSFVNPENSIKV